MNKHFFSRTALMSLFVGLLLSSSMQAQTLDRAQQWYQLDLKKDELFGTSVDLAYFKVADDVKIPEVIVAVIDGGVDVEHEDLKEVLWVNRGEVPDNGIDDDGNGYVDDVYGWSFISGENGEVNEDTYELTRELVRLRKLAAEGQVLKGSTDEGYLKVLEKAYAKKLKAAEKGLKNMTGLKEAHDAFITHLAGKSLNEARVASFQGKGKWGKIVKSYFESAVKNEVPLEEASEGLLGGYDHYNYMVNFGLNLSHDPRWMVGDQYAEVNERFYGDNRVKGPKSEHGTHVAGIIAAQRHNGVGMNGIAVNARIMTLRVVPKGDERDKDIANAIRYAVDNGAKVINMSFGKDYSPNADVVAEAVAYALSKDVLLVHAAGNDSKDVDKNPNFPAPYHGDGVRFPNWTEVGASSFRPGMELPASFTNYGAERVDVFAPGHYIYATIPENKYDFNSGTSMAAPVVAGIAAVIRGMYPQLTAVQVRQVIMDSAIPYNDKVRRPGSKKAIPFSSMSQAGGVANLLSALEAAKKLAAG